MTPEQLARQALRAISLNRRAELSGGSHSHSRQGATIRDDEDHHEAAVNPDTGFVGTLELRSTPDASGSTKRLRTGGYDAG